MASKLRLDLNCLRLQPSAVIRLQRCDRRRHGAENLCRRIHRDSCPILTDPWQCKLLWHECGRHFDQLVWQCSCCICCDRINWKDSDQRSWPRLPCLQVLKDGCSCALNQRIYTNGRSISISYNAEIWLGAPRVDPCAILKRQQISGQRVSSTHSPRNWQPVHHLIVRVADLRIVVV